MERRLAFLQLYGNWIPELLLLFVVEYSVYGVHVACESRDGKIRPAMTTRNVLQTAVFSRRVVKPNPARKMRKRLRARPVGVILMPGDDATVMRRLAKELIVPEAHRPFQ